MTKPPTGLRVVRSFILLFLTGMVVLPAVPAAAGAQQGAQEPTVRISKDQARTFAGALTALAAQGRVAFVAEGEPLKAALSEAEVDDHFAEGAAALPLSAAVEKVATSYDYDAALAKGGGLFVLRKRYSDPNDLPGVTLEECRLAVRDVLHVLSRYDPAVLQAGMSDDPALQELMASLSPAQLEALQDKQVRLPVSALSPRQRELVWRFALHAYVQTPTNDLRHVRARFDTVLHRDTWFGWSEMLGLRLFGYEGPQAEPLHPGSYFRPLSHAHLVQYGPGGSASIAQAPRPFNRDGTPNERPHADPTQPTPADVEAGKNEAAFGSTTLGAAVAALNARGGDAVKFALDETLAAKPVTVVGGEKAAPARVLAALADAYGLPIKEDKDGTLRLARPKWRAATTVAALGASIRGVFPDPLVRALRLDALEKLRAEDRAVELRQAQQNAAAAAREAARQEAGAPRPEPTQAQIDAWRAEAMKRWEQQQERSRRWQQLMDRPDTLRVAAMRRLRAGVEPKLKGAPNERVGLEALGGPERRALANILMADCLSSLRGLLGREVPGYITRFDQVVLSGGYGNGPDGKAMFALSLDMPNPEGTGVRQGPGFAAYLRERK